MSAGASVSSSLAKTTKVALAGLFLFMLLIAIVIGIIWYVVIKDAD